MRIENLKISRLILVRFLYNKLYRHEFLHYIKIKFIPEA